MEIIKEVTLVANSVRKAEYRVSLLRLAEGYAVEKISGPSGKRGVPDAWYRRSLDEAEKKFSDIIREKTRPGRKRQYHEEPQPPVQALLFV